MNNAIADCYLEQIKTRNLSERELKEAIYASIRSDNTMLLEACMGKLPTDEEYWGEDRHPMYFAIREMASFKIIRILVENGYKLPYHPDLLPWNGSPEDSINLIMKDNGADKEKAIAYFVYSVCYYLEVMKTSYSGFRVPFNMETEDIYKPCFFSYLDNWLSGFAVFLENESVNYNYNGKDIDLLIARIAQYQELTGALKTFINSPLFDKENIGWYLRIAVLSDNEDGFDILAEIADENDFKEIKHYPKHNMSLLNKLFERNILIPGTDEAYEAFEGFFSFMEKVDEEEEDILKAIMHPSYGDKRDEFGRTILIRAIKNRHFEPYLYPVLVTSPMELNARDNEGRTALYYLARTEYPECLEILTRMGAIPFCIDAEGNNVLHILLGGDWKITLDDIMYDMGYLPKELITMKNAEGKTPLDILRNRLYESKSE